MRLFLRADWLFGFLWASVVCLFHIAASVFVFGQRVDTDLYLTYLSLWTVGFLFMSLAVGFKRREKR